MRGDLPLASGRQQIPIRQRRLLVGNARRHVLQRADMDPAAGRGRTVRVRRLPYLVASCSISSWRLTRRHAGPVPGNRKNSSTRPGSAGQAIPTIHVPRGQRNCPGGRAPAFRTDRGGLVSPNLWTSRPGLSPWFLRRAYSLWMKATCPVILAENRDGPPSDDLADDIDQLIAE